MTDARGPDPGQLALAHGHALLDALVQAGLQQMVICPGSRSAPLAMAAAAHPQLQTQVHLDERSAAFYALGWAMSRQTPAGLLCTSGTAGANFLPAVVEAHYARVPLVILTADRPDELRPFGAPQTIDQVHLYGRYVKWFVDMPMPENHSSVWHFLHSTACRAMATARSDPAGPVHLNVPLREPLLPDATAEHIPSTAAARVRTTAGGTRPELRGSTAPRVPDDGVLRELTDELRTGLRGLVVCGPQANRELTAAVIPMASVLGYPVLADPLSGVRCGHHDLAPVIDAYDAFLRHEPTRDGLTPDLVIRLGAIPTSKALLQCLDRWRSQRQILIDVGGTWPDPVFATSWHIEADPAATCRGITALLAAGFRRTAPEPGSSGPDSMWLREWQEINRVTRTAIAECVAGFQAPFEGRIFSELSEILPDGAALFAGNSMPVRDLDTFFPTRRRGLRFMANRGANGIDGVVSTALGAAGAGSTPLVLVIGDLSFYHDLNGLLAAKRFGIDLTVVLVHNDGSGIFSFLPQAGFPEFFETLFGTPHGLDFSLMADFYGARYTRPTTWQAFREEIGTALAARGLNIVEVRTDRITNVEQHAAVWSAVARALSPANGA